MNQRMQNLAQDIARVVDSKLNALRQEIESKFGDFGAELRDVQARLQTLEDRHSTPPDEDAIAALRNRLYKVESGATNTSISKTYPTLLIKGLTETDQETMDVQMSIFDRSALITGGSDVSGTHRIHRQRAQQEPTSSSNISHE